LLNLHTWKVAFAVAQKHMFLGNGGC
jgi:hypothetical protein